MKRLRIPAGLVQYLGLLASLAVLPAIFGLLSDNFFQFRTLVTIANRIPDLTFIAVGMTFVLIIGGIDLSVGSLLALSAAVLGALMVDVGWPLWAAVIASLVVGLLCGLLNGTIAILARIPSFIVTLGMLEIARGATQMVVESKTKYIGSAVEPISEPMAGLQVSPAFVLAIVTVLAGQFILTRTVFGRYLIAIGTNEEAVRMSGIRTAPYAISVFALSGFLCAVAGLVQTSRLSSADPNAAIGMELSAIAACVIGGTSLMGGRGSVIASFLGVLVIAVLQTGLAQIGAHDPTKKIITGSVIIGAVLLDALRTRWSRGNPHD